MKVVLFQSQYINYINNCRNLKKKLKRLKNIVFQALLFHRHYLLMNVRNTSIDTPC